MRLLLNSIWKREHIASIHDSSLAVGLLPTCPTTAIKTCKILCSMAWSAWWWAWSPFHCISRWSFFYFFNGTFSPPLSTFPPFFRCPSWNNHSDSMTTCGSFEVFLKRCSSEKMTSLARPVNSLAGQAVFPPGKSRQNGWKNNNKSEERAEDLKKWTRNCLEYFKWKQDSLSRRRSIVINGIQCQYLKRIFRFYLFDCTL